MKIYSFLMLVLLLGIGLANAADPKRQQQVKQEIKQLSSSLSANQSNFDALQAEVTRTEKKLSDVSQRLHQTEKKIEETVARLQTANEKKLKQESELNIQRTGLAQQLQALYTAGEESHLRLLLRQDDPSDISRTMRYFDYMNASRVKRIHSIQKTLTELQTLRLTIDKDRQYLQNLEQTQEKDKAELTHTLAERSDRLQKMNSDSRAKQKRLEKLHKEDASLAEIIERLSSAEQKSPDAPPKATKDTASPKDTPKATEKKPDITVTPVKARFTPDKAFSTLKGSLSWPVSGKITHPYGSAKNEKQRWRGVVISAPGGTKVKAVARGRVVFAGWMDTYGHMIIIEHDNNYISLYGYNRAVYKKEGAIVNANETIAAVGASGGQSRDGLYFEIRQGKTPQNPARWCR